MKKNIQIALTSIVLVLVSILGLTIMLHGMYSKINAKGATESRDATRSGMVESNNSTYQKFTAESWYHESNGTRQFPKGSFTTHQVSWNKHTLDENDIKSIITDPTKGKQVGSKYYYWLEIKGHVNASLTSYIFPENTIVHLRLNGYTISGNFKIKLPDSSELRLYDYIFDDIPLYSDSQQPQNGYQPTRFYRWNAATGAYTDYQGTTTDGQAPGSLRDPIYIDTTDRPSFQNNTYIKVKGSAIAPGPQGTMASAHLQGHIELYGVNIVGNTSPSNSKSGGLIDVNTSAAHLKLGNCSIIGNNVQDVAAALALTHSNISKVDIRWCNIYSNYTGSNHTYGVYTSDSSKAIISDIYAPNSARSVNLVQNTLGILTAANKKGGIYLRYTNLNGLSKSLDNSSLLGVIENMTQLTSHTGKKLELIDGATFTVRNAQKDLNISLAGSGNTLNVETAGKTGTIEEGRNPSNNTYNIVGTINNDTNTLNTNGTVNINNVSRTITLSGSPTVYGDGKAIIQSGVSALVPNGKILKQLENNGIVNVEGSVTTASGSGTLNIRAGGLAETITATTATSYISIEQNGIANLIDGNDCTIDIYSNGRVKEISGNSTVNMRGGTAEKILGDGNVTMNGGTATITGGNRTLSGSSGNVIIQNNATATVPSGTNLDAPVTVKGGSTLKVLGNASKITGENNSTVNMQDNAATATIVNGATNLSGNGRLVTIENNVTATVPSGTLNAAVTNKGTLNVEGNVSNITGENNSTINMQGGNASILAGNSKLLGNSGQVIIQQNATATVEQNQTVNAIIINNGTLTIKGTANNISGNGQKTEIISTGQATVVDRKELSGTVINNGILNVAGNASGATLTNNNSLNLAATGKLPGNFNNATNATLTVQSGASYTITNDLGGTINNSGTVTITNGTVQTLNNNSGANVKIEGDRITINNLTNNGIFTVVSGTYVIPDGKSLSGTVVNETNGIIELQGTLSTTSFTNNGSLRIPKGKIYTIGGSNGPNSLSGNILNSGTLNLDGQFTGTLINEASGEVHLSQNGELPGGNNFTNNGTLVINDGVTKTITAPSGSGTIKNQGHLTISGNAIVVNSPVTTNSIVELTITSGTVQASGTATTIQVNGHQLKVVAGETLTAESINSTTNGRIEIHGIVYVTAINSNNQFHLKSTGELYGIINLSGGVRPVIEGKVGDVDHPNTILNIRVDTDVYNGANIWNLAGTRNLLMNGDTAVVNVRNNQFTGTISNTKGIVNLYDNATVKNLTNAANTNDQGVFIKGDYVSITNLNNTGRFTIEANKTFTVISSTALNGTVINYGTLNLEGACGATLQNENRVNLRNGDFTANCTNNGILNVNDGITTSITNLKGTGSIINQGNLTISGNTTVENRKATANSTVSLTITSGTVNTYGNATTIQNERNGGIIIVPDKKTLTADTITSIFKMQIYGTVDVTDKIDANNVFELFSGGKIYGKVNIITGYVYAVIIKGSIGDEQHPDSVLNISAPDTGERIVTAGEGAYIWNVTSIGTATRVNISHSTAVVNVRGNYTGVIQNNAGTVNLYSGAIVRDLMNGTNSLGVYIKGTNVTVGEKLSNSGIFRIENAASFTLKENLTLGGTTINDGGILTVNGTVNDLSGTGTVTINTNGEKNGQVTVKSGKSLDGTITNSGVLNIEGTLTATNTLTNTGVLNLLDNVNYTVLNTMTLGGTINNRGTLIVEGTANVVNNHKDLTVNGTVAVVTNNSITKSTDAQVIVKGIVNDLSGNSIVTISSTGNVTVVEDKGITGTVTNDGGTLTVHGIADDVLGNGTLTINTNGDKVGEVTVKSGNTLSGNVKNNGILNMDGTLDISDFINDGTFNLNKGGNILNPFTNNGTFQIGKDVTYEVREQDNLTNGTVVNNGVLTVGVGKINNLVSHGTTDIQANVNVNTLVIQEGYTTLYDESIVGSAELKANGTLEIFNKANLTNLTHNEGGTLIYHGIAPNPALRSTRGFSWLWLLIIISGILLLILLILILLLIKRKREEVIVNEIYDRVEDISLYTQHRDE